MVRPLSKARFSNHCQSKGHKERLEIASEVFEVEMGDGSRDSDEILADIPDMVDVIMGK